jgi:dipeptidase E
VCDVKLYLSSYRLGSRPEVLRELVGGRGRAGLIFNALDVYGRDRLRVLPRERDDLASLGFDTEELDLRDYFGDFDGLRRRLLTLDLLWVTGGNTFCLARAMTHARFNEAIDEPLQRNSIVYASYSAGTCVTADDLAGIQLMDEPDAIAEGHPLGLPAHTLGWLPYRIVPHWHSDHPESPAADLAVSYLLSQGLPFRTLKDGQAIVIAPSGSAPRPA